MKHPHEEKLSEAHSVLYEAQQQLEAILQGDDMQMLRLKITSALNGLINTLNGLTGTVNFSGQKVEGLKPLKTFMGRDVVARQPITEQDTSPGLDEADIFLAKRDLLYGRFLTMNDEQIIAYLKEPMGETLVRSVAKKAGISDFMDAEMNVELFNDIRTSMLADIDEEETVNRAEDAYENLVNKQADIDGDVDDEEETVAPPAQPPLPKKTTKAAPAKKAPKQSK